MSHNDASFFRTFALVLGALVLFTLFIGVLANAISPKSDGDPLVMKEQAKQIAPVGQNRVAAAPAAESTAAVAATAATAAVAEVADTAEATVQAETTEAEAAETDTAAVETATTEAEAATAEPEEISIDIADVPVRVKAVVATNCAGCHQDGLYGAQRNDDAQAWQALADKGLDTLTASVINGKGAMLPRAETSLSDEEISLAVRYMVVQATDGADSDGAGDAAAETEAESAAEEETAAEAETAATAESTEEATETTAVAAAEVPDNIKSVVDGLCSSCHVTGVGNAPKFGDKDAWDQRLAKGMDQVLATAISGVGAMPPRGGATQLSDAELRLAIEYMLTK